MSILVYHRDNPHASTPPRTTAAKMESASLRAEMSRTRSEIAHVLRGKLAMRAYPFAPGSQPFRLMSGRAA